MNLTPDKVLNSLVYGAPFCVVIYMSYKPSYMVQFLWLKLIGIFGVVQFLILCKEYLNMATFRIPVLLLVKS